MWLFENLKFHMWFPLCYGFPDGSDVKNPPARDLGSILGLEISHGGGHGNPLQCSCLENPVDREAWRATVHGISKSQTRQGHGTVNAESDLLSLE